MYALFGAGRHHLQLQRDAREVPAEGLGHPGYQLLAGYVSLSQKTPTTVVFGCQISNQVVVNSSCGSCARSSTILCDSLEPAARLSGQPACALRLLFALLLLRTLLSYDSCLVSLLQFASCFVLYCLSLLILSITMIVILTLMFD